MSEYYGYKYHSPEFQDYLHKALCLDCYRSLFTSKVGSTPAPRQRTLLGLGPITNKREARKTVCMECGGNLVLRKISASRLKRYTYAQENGRWFVIDRRVMNVSHRYNKQQIYGEIVGEGRTRQEARDFCDKKTLENKPMSSEDAVQLLRVIKQDYPLPPYHYNPAGIFQYSAWGYAVKFKHPGAGMVVVTSPMDYNRSWKPKTTTRGGWAVYRDDVLIAVLGYDMTTREAVVVSDAPSQELDFVTDYADSIRAGAYPVPSPGLYSNQLWKNHQISKGNLLVATTWLVHQLENKSG